MATILGILALVLVPALAFAIRKAARGTPFEHRCPCTPYVEHLRWLENGKTKAKKEQLW